MVKPILRPGLPWYMNNFDTVCKFFDIGINTLGLNNITKLDCVSRMAQQFDDKGVHLTPTAGKMFIEAILMTAEAYFKAESVDLTKEDEFKSSEASGSGLSTRNQSEAHESRLNCLESDVRRRRFMDNLMMARVREELDAITNTKKEDRVVITGMMSDSPAPEKFLREKRLA